MRYLPCWLSTGPTATPELEHMHYILKEYRLRLKLLFKRPLTAGSRDWLIDKELKYGGLVRELPYRVSRYDNVSQIVTSGGHRVTNRTLGGDRMAPYSHDYAPIYEQFLRPFLSSEERSGHSVTVIEVGILRGTGLAIWSDLFPKGRIIGLDFDLSNYRTFRDSLKKMGAFSTSEPETYEFDGYADNTSLLRHILNGATVDIAIDDASHEDISILSTFESMRAYLSEKFVYFVEDNSRVHEKIEQRFPEYDVTSLGEMTVIRNRE